MIIPFQTINLQRCPSLLTRTPTNGDRQLTNHAEIGNFPLLGEKEPNYWFASTLKSITLVSVSNFRSPSLHQSFNFFLPVSRSSVVHPSHIPCDLLGGLSLFPSRTSSSKSISLRFVHIPAHCLVFPKTSRTEKGKSLVPAPRFPFHQFCPSPSVGIPTRGQLQGSIESFAWL